MINDSRDNIMIYFSLVIVRSFIPEYIVKSYDVLN